MKDINKLNWGAITPEFYNEEKKSAIHVFNHCLIGEENIIRAITFAVGRIEWYQTHLPKGCCHEVVFDDRGQNIDDSIRNRITESLDVLALNVRFASKGR